MHLPEIWSAIDIPEALPQAAIHADAIRAHNYFPMLKDDPQGPGAEIALDKIAADLKLDRSLVEQVAAAGSASAEDLASAARGTLLEEEWAAFQAVIEGSLENSVDFVARTTHFLAGDESAAVESLGSAISSVVLVERLREVRAMKEFRRYSAEAKPVSANLGPAHSEFWYPAVETFGEGVFFSFDEGALRQWEERVEVTPRVEVLTKRADASPIGSRHEPVAARSIMMHTLSHLLMRRLAFNSGYGAASLRERVYSSTEGARAGVLIFTASGDSEGTLGGLVRQGHAPNFGRLVLSAIEDAEWCSNDPVCGESRGQGMNALNLAACHACSLAPETSCDRSNLFLDRTLVVGNSKTPGFFDEQMRLAREQLSARQNNGAR